MYRYLVISGPALLAREGPVVRTFDSVSLRIGMYTGNMACQSMCGADVN